MKLSESLLYDKEIGLRIFNSGVEKSKKFLKDIFLLDFNSPDEKFNLTFCEEPTALKFRANFTFNGRDITAELRYEKENTDILNETLAILENTTQNFILQPEANNFQDYVDYVLIELEKKYYINFLPLNPDEQDNNIKSFIMNEKNNYFETTFTSDDHEGHFKVVVTYNPGETSAYYEVTHYKQHNIYFD